MFSRKKNDCLSIFWTLAFTINGLTVIFFTLFEGSTIQENRWPLKHDEIYLNLD